MFSGKAVVTGYRRDTLIYVGLNDKRWLKALISYDLIA